MNILLIKPPTSKFVFPGDKAFMGEPLDIEYVAAGVSDRYNVRVLDMRVDKSLEKHLAEFAPDVVGLTSYIPQVYITKNLCKEIKAFNPDILTVVGGLHATIVPQDYLDPNINIIVRGEGVLTFREIVERFEKKEDITDVKGIAFPQNGGLQFSEPRSYRDLNHLPFPNRSLTEHYRENYFLESPDEVLKPLANLLTSKGCPFRCKFCAQWKLTNGKYLARDPHSILEELKTIKEPYVYFVDDETYVDIKRMDKLADLIIDAGIRKKILSLARSDTVISYPDVFKKWKKAGLNKVVIGAESHRAGDLEYFRKQTTASNNEKAIAILKKLGVRVHASFIVFPDYDIEDFDILADYVKKLDADFVSFMPLTPLPGTDLHDELKDQLTTDNYELFDLTHAVLPTKLPLHKFYRELAYLIYRVNKDKFKGLLAESDPSLATHFLKLQKELKNLHLHHQNV